jgi:hypothetical protein
VPDLPTVILIYQLEDSTIALRWEVLLRKLPALGIARHSKARSLAASNGRHLHYDRCITSSITPSRRLHPADAVPPHQSISITMSATAWQLNGRALNPAMAGLPY